MTRTAAVDLTLIVGIAACVTTAILGTVSGSWEVFRCGLIVIAIATGAPIGVAWAAVLVTSIRYRINQKDYR